MTLTLTVLRCPDRVAPETRTLSGGDLVLGRGPGADWVLADPSDKPRLSRRHCTIAYARGGWTVTDTSTNGTLLNGEATPQGGPSRALRNGDRLGLGPYEIEILLAAEAAPLALNPFRESAFGSPFDDAGGGLAPHSVRLPDDFAAELLRDAAPGPFTQPDTTPAHADAIRPPVARTVLPSGWDISDEAPLPTVPLSPPPPPPAAGRLPAGPPAELAAAPEPAAVPPPVAPPPSAAPGATESTLLAAFLEGAGMPDADPADPAAALRGAGEAFRAFVAGLRAVLIARAEVKSAFRITRTMVRTRRNNPLKFAAGDDDALAALLGAGRRTDMGAAEAVQEALADIALHELATMSAMQVAVRDLLGQLDPARFRAAAEGGLLPLQRRAHAFDLYEAAFATLREALAENFDDAFGRAFAEAYERVVADLQGGRPLS